MKHDPTTAHIPAAAWAAQSSSGRVNSGRLRPLPKVSPVIGGDRKDEKLRDCLKCRTPFKSANAGHRVCPDCIAVVNKRIEGL